MMITKQIQILPTTTSSSTPLAKAKALKKDKYFFDHGGKCRD